MVTSINMASIRLYEEPKHAAAYATFRPTYPEIIYDTVSTFIKKYDCSGFDVAVDVACGSGQSTFPLCSQFQRVIGVDISEAQIINARAKVTENLQGSKNIEFIVGDAHDLPLESSSADLITCATAWHWLDPELFYREAKRILKPKGCLAVYGYRHGSELVGDYYCQTLVSNFIDCLKEEGCWHEKNVHCENMYAAAELPFAKTQRQEFLMPWETNLTHLIGFLSSMDGYDTYNEKYPDNTLLEDLKKAYLDAKGESKANLAVKYVFTGYIIVGQNN